MRLRGLKVAGTLRVPSAFVSVCYGTRSVPATKALVDIRPPAGETIAFAVPILWRSKADQLP
jgi:hypothetical protein